MNERIRELAEQATDKWVGGEFFDRQKFAELIVRECIRLCDQVDIVGADECINNIKEHFEVEE
jgi:hypothetical protein